MTFWLARPQLSISGPTFERAFEPIVNI